MGACGSYYKDKRHNMTEQSQKWEDEMKQLTYVKPEQTGLKRQCHKSDDEVADTKAAGEVGDETEMIWATHKCSTYFGREPRMPSYSDPLKENNQKKNSIKTLL